MVVDWKRFVPGAEVEDLSFAATESTRGAKDFASLKPTNHYSFVGCGNVEKFSMQFGRRQVDRFMGQSVDDRVTWVDDLQSFLFASVVSSWFPLAVERPWRDELNEGR